MDKVSRGTIARVEGHRSPGVAFFLADKARPSALVRLALAAASRDWNMMQNGA